MLELPGIDYAHVIATRKGVPKGFLSLHNECRHEVS